jgi:hypothetical protein
VLPRPDDGAELEPLLGFCRGLPARSLSAFGSAARMQLHEAAELDLHIVVPTVDRSVYRSVVAAAEQVLQRTGRPWRLELRHGPFKSEAGILQLHLILDDLRSLQQSAWVLRLQRAATGRLLTGSVELELLCPPAQRYGEARRELLRWRTALADLVIPYRRWQLDPSPRLLEATAPVTSPGELWNLLRAAALMTDLHYRTLDPAALPLLGQLDGNPTELLVAAAVEGIDRRLDRLSRMC